MTTPLSTAAKAAKAASRTTTAITINTTVTGGLAIPSKTTFLPRPAYDVSPQIPRSYYLGHHHAALSRMRQNLSNIGLIIECRDFRVPLSSWNPLLEQSLMANTASSPDGSGRARIIVYTKRDLGPFSSAAAVRTLRNFHTSPSNPSRATDVLFLGSGPDFSKSLNPLLDAIKRVARERDALTGMRAMVVGMPNAGKSTLLNRLRTKSLGLGKAAKTGSEPGVTRKLGTPVRIVLGEGGSKDGAVAGERGMGEGVFVVDTPGVFMPYVSDPEAMMKLALVGCVKDGLIPRIGLADYLLYQLNLAGPEGYMKKFNMSRPTNDVDEFLWAVGKRTGKLEKGGQPSMEKAADWAVQEWRRGGLGKLLLDEVTNDTLTRAMENARDGGDSMSMNQARKKEKEERKEKKAANWAAISATAR